MRKRVSKSVDYMTHKQSFTENQGILSELWFDQNQVHEMYEMPLSLKMSQVMKNKINHPISRQISTILIRYLNR